MGGALLQLHKLDVWVTGVDGLAFRAHHTISEVGVEVGVMPTLAVDIHAHVRALPLDSAVRFPAIVFPDAISVEFSFGDLVVHL